MHRPSSTRSRGRGVRSFRNGRWRRPGGRGVSDVIATILLLALTVTLFASIFAFVGAFPQPTPQAQNEFQSSLVIAANGTYLTGITITHLAGPVLPTSDHILLASSRVQSAWQFNVGGSGIPVGWGLGNTSTGWALGQVWSTSFTKLVKVPDNITVYVVTATQLLYSATLPAITQNIPPAVQEVGTSPSSLTVGEAFQVWATLSGNTTSVSVTVNLNGIPGLSGVKAMVNDSYVWVYNVTAATTKAGTYYAFITVTAASGQTVSQSVPIVVAASGGGGGSSSLSVSVGVSPQPLSVPSYTLYPYAVITYTGSASSVPVYVNFTIVQSVGGKKALVIEKTTDNGPTGNTISGPNSTTIYALNSMSSWYLNGSVVIYANASLPGVGKAYGTLAIPAYNLVQGIVYFTTSGTAPAPQGALSTSHSCTTSTCPFLFLTVWDNFTAATYGGPADIWVSGTVYTNSTTGGYTLTKTIASTEVAVGSSVNVNAITAGSTTARWASPGGNKGTVYYAYLWLTVSLTSGGAAIGYIYDVSPSLTFSS
ncbi:MAG TPA: type IV pilin N-terminal domain-containing protein [Thermoplasmata archaeon]|nr:type IV pilin N-terminal domain-containing protein [Thermoplasmata archaeon]